jgi:hypothetical protein
MAAKTTFLAGRVLDQVLKHNAEFSYTWPTTVYAALFTSDPTVAGLFTGEVATGAGVTDYARQPITWATIGVGNSVSNSTAITYPVSTAGYGASPIGWVGICDTVATASGMLYQGPLVTPKTITAGDQVSFAIGALVMTEV